MRICCSKQCSEPCTTQTSECMLQVECSDMFRGDILYSLVRPSSAERLQRLFECELVSVAAVQNVIWCDMLPCAAPLKWPQHLKQ